jgi:hypothetical protein
VAIKVISITAINCIFCIARVFKLNKSITRRPWRNFQVDIHDTTILVEEILNFPLADVAWEVAHVYRAAVPSGHGSCD